MRIHGKLGFLTLSLVLHGGAALGAVWLAEAFRRAPCSSPRRKWQSVELHIPRTTPRRPTKPTRAKQPTRAKRPAFAKRPRSTSRSQLRASPRRAPRRPRLDRWRHLRVAKQRVATANPQPPAPQSPPAPQKTTPLRMRDLDVSPERDFGALPAPPRPTPAAPPSDAQRLKKRIDRWLSQAVGQANVAQGNVDPFFHQLTRRLMAEFRPPESVLPPRRSPTAEMLRSYLSSASRFGRGPTAALETRRDTRARISAEMAAKAAGTSAYNTTAATVCVRITAGVPQAPALERSSGLPDVDDWARRALTQALEVRGVSREATRKKGWGPSKANKTHQRPPSPPSGVARRPPQNVRHRAGLSTPTGLHDAHACYRLSVHYGRDYIPPLLSPLGALGQLLSKRGNRVFFSRVELLSLRYTRSAERREKATGAASQHPQTQGAPPRRKQPHKRPDAAR